MDLYKVLQVGRNATLGEVSYSNINIDMCRCI